MTVTQALRAFFHPHDPEELALAASENRRLLLRGDRPDSFAKLLPWAILNTLLTADGLVDGSMRAARQGRDLPLEMLAPLDRLKNQRHLNPQALQSLCRQGMSLVLNRTDRQVPAIAAMNAMLERFMRCDTFTNTYVSFRRDSALRPHYDSHNVLIAQVHGRKRWWCHGQVDRFPLTSRGFPDLRDLPPPSWEAVLEPGDMLFVPRGDVHRAEVDGECSVHLTIGMIPPTGQQVIRWIERRALESEDARQDVPTLADPEALRGRAQSLKCLLHRLVDEMDLAEFLAAADQDRAPVQPLNLGLDHQLGPATMVEPTLRRRIPLRADETGGCTLSLGELAIKLSAAERGLLEALLDRDRMTMAEVMAILPGIDAKATVTALAGRSLVFLREAP